MLTYFEYHPEKNALLAGMHTVIKAKIKVIYPMISIEKIVNGSLFVLRMEFQWVHSHTLDNSSNRPLELVDVNYCFAHQGHDYICEGMHRPIRDICGNSGSNASNGC